MSYYDDIFEKVEGVPREEFDSLVREVVERSGGFLSPRAAAVYVALTLGAKIDRVPPEPIVGRLLDVGQVRRSRGREGETPYVLFTVVNESGRLRCVAFGEHHIRKLKEAEDRVIALRDYVIAKLEKVTMVKVKESSEIEVLPDSEMPGILEIPSAWAESLKQGEELEETLLFKAVVLDERVEEYLACPLCGREVERRGSDYLCPEHGRVIPERKRLWRFLVGDGSGAFNAVSRSPPPVASAVGRMATFKGYFRGGELTIKKFYEVSEPVL